MSAEAVDEFSRESVAYQPIDGEFPGSLRVSLLDQVHIIGEREGGLVECLVPTELIDHGDVAVKKEYVTSMAKQMRRTAAKNGGSGQNTPIMLAMIEDHAVFKIADGFHRDAALVANDEPVIYATVRNMELDDLYDFRIFTAKDHAQVRFSRVVQWIREVWEFSGLATKLTVEQAVLLYRFESSGKKLGLSEEDVTKAKGWVERKEEQWDIKSMTIHSYLKIAENVDPTLVHATREKIDNKVLEAPTQAIIHVFSEVLPKKFELQKLVMDAARAHNLKGPEVKALCKSVMDSKTTEEANQIIAEIDWGNWQPEYGKSTQNALRRAYDPRFKGAAVLNRIESDMQNIRSRVNSSIERREDVDESNRRNIRTTVEGLQQIRRDIGHLVIELTKLSELVPIKKEIEASPTQPKKPRALTLVAPLDEATKQEVIEQIVEPILEQLEQEDRPEPPETIPEPLKVSSPTVRRSANVAAVVRTKRKPQPDKREQSHREPQNKGFELIKERGAFEVSLKDFLDGKIEDVPIVRNRRDATIAEQMLINSAYAGSANNAEKMREGIDEFYRLRNSRFTK